MWFCQVGLFVWKFAWYIFRLVRQFESLLRFCHERLFETLLGVFLSCLFATVFVCLCHLFKPCLLFFSSLFKLHSACLYEVGLLQTQLDVSMPSWFLVFWSTSCFMADVCASVGLEKKKEIKLRVLLNCCCFL